MIGESGFQISSGVFLMREEVIIEKIRSGNPAGLEALMDRYLPYVSAVVWHILRNAMPAEDGEEIVSDVFLAAWSRPEALRPGSVKAWLGAVARNKALDVLRRLPPTCPLDEDCPSPAEGPQETLERREQARQLWQAVDGLEEPDRTLFFRYYYQEEKLKEIAMDLGLNPATAKTRLARGRKRLRGILTKGGAAGEKAF